LDCLKVTMFTMKTAGLVKDSFTRKSDFELSLQVY
jgi:hypothetical protein